MNLKIELSNENQELLNQIGIEIEDKNYNVEEIKRCENDIINHIMSKSLKNKDLSKESIKYSNLIDILVKNEK
jgi:hypothetical protein